MIARRAKQLNFGNGFYNKVMFAGFELAAFPSTAATGQGGIGAGGQQVHQRRYKGQFDF
jgi:hypothetical protein